MANEEKKLMDDMVKLLTDIALNKSGLTSEHTERALDLVAKASKVKPASGAPIVYLAA